MSKVYLVGAGPGDPELLTLKGRRLLAQADCVLFDNLVNHALVDLAPATAEKIYVGKKKALHSHTQDEICRMLVERGLRGLNVVRLKGGDPFLFGRGGEEAEALAAAGVPFEVVPGVTVPLGIAAYTGVPLTHRDHTSVVTFVTGHDVSRIDWSKVGHAETLVIFMGLTTFDQIAREIMARGRSPETPAMVVRWATRPDQCTITGTLATLPGLIHEHDLKPPATIVVGEVVAMRGKLDWYERLPLFGQTVVITRGREQAAALAGPLHALGANVIELPAIEIGPAQDYGPLDHAIENLPSYDWLIFTSANGVRCFFERLDRSPRDPRSIRARIAVIGPGTQAALEAFHLKVDVTADVYVAEGLIGKLGDCHLEGKRVLIPRAAAARDTLPAALRDRGAHVDVVEAYRTTIPANLEAAARHVLASERRPDWITFTSASTVNHLVRTVGAEALKGIRLASIGPITTEAARKLGVEIAVEASRYTMDGLVEEIQRAGIIGT